MRLESETQRFYLGRDYSEAVEAAGGLPVHIPLIPDEEFIRSVVAELDGILLPGCDSDVDPAYYAEDPHPKLGRVIPEKDKTDLLMLAEAERLGLPVLAICYGIQVLNISRGGSLIQDIETQVENCIQHEQGRPLDRNSHTIKIDRNNLLSELIGRGDASVELKVNSHHHQAVRKTGRDLKAIAWANDGIVEAIQDSRPERFVLGVQWHPELSWKTDKLSGEIFRMFVSSCRKAVSQKQSHALDEALQVLTPS